MRTLLRKLCQLTDVPTAQHGAWHYPAWRSRVMQINKMPH